MIVIMVFSAVIHLSMSPKYELEYGRRGRDTVTILGNGKFQIGKYGNQKKFVMYQGEHLHTPLLEHVILHKIYNKRYLYVYSKEGYAIADAQTNTCRLFITVPDEEFVNGWTSGEDGVKRPISRYVEDEHVSYLENFEEFSEEERARFDELLSKKQ